MSRAIKQALGVMMAVAMSGQDFAENDFSSKPKGSKPIRKVTPPVPKELKVWPEYGNVVALNEKNAKRKYENLNK